MVHALIFVPNPNPNPDSDHDPDHDLVDTGHCRHKRRLDLFDPTAVKPTSVLNAMNSFMRR